MQILSRPSRQPSPNWLPELVAGIALAGAAGLAHLLRALEQRAASTPISTAGTIPNGESAE